MAVAELTCRTCGKTLHKAHTGRPPRYCPEHRPKQARDARNAEASAKAHQQDFADAGLLSPGASTIDENDSWDSRRLAAAIGLSKGNRADAAAISGLAPNRIHKLWKLAHRYPDLIARKPSAIAELLSTGLTMAAIRIAGEMANIPVSQLPTATRAVAQALELVGGTAAGVYSELTIQVVAPR